MEADKIVAFIPARGGSKSIPLKNIKPIAGRPLICWVLDAVTGCPAVNRAVVSTDSPEIRSCVEQYAAEAGVAGRLSCVARSDETAGDFASTESAMLEYARTASFDKMLLVQATSPLLEARHLAEAIADFEKGGFDSMLSVVRQKRFLWRTDANGRAVPQNYDCLRRPMRQQFEGFLVENGAFYLTSRENLLETECRLSGRIGVYEMPEESYFEIDEPSDWAIVEQLLKRARTGAPRISAKGIALFAMDCDGVLTDGGMYYGIDGSELKKFNTLDGVGVSKLRNAGIVTALITSENTDIVDRRAKKLKIDEVFQGVTDKLSVIRQLAEKYDLSLDQIAYIGDDLGDLEVLQNVGLSITVPNATSRIKSAAAFTTLAQGGSGAVREAAEMVLSLAG